MTSVSDKHPEEMTLERIKLVQREEGFPVFQANELFNLLVGAIGLLIIFSSFRKLIFPWVKAFILGYLFFFSSTVFTILEGFFWFSLFNVLEHTAHVFTGLCFFWGCFRLFRDSSKSIV